MRLSAFSEESSGVDSSGLERDVKGGLRPLPRLLGADTHPHKQSEVTARPQMRSVSDAKTFTAHLPLLLSGCS